MRNRPDRSIDDDFEDQDDMFELSDEDIVDVIENLDDFDDVPRNRTPGACVEEDFDIDDVLEL